MTTFTSIFAPSEIKPRPQFFTGNPINFLRDALSLQTWIALGALMQSLLLLVLPINIAILPAIVYLVTRFIDSVLLWQGIRPNPYMSNVIPGKVSAQFPGSTTPSQNPIVVIRLAACSNHPLGTFHPHMRVISSYFRRMIKDLEDNSEQYGFLGASSYIASERAAANETMILVYFRTYEGLHAWSHAAGGVHREALNYWNSEIMGNGKQKVGRLFSIMHEVYQIPAKKWESIYVNYHPTGLGATTYKVNVDGQEKWASPLIDASKGSLRTSKGRLGLGEENVESDLYGNY